MIDNLDPTWAGADEVGRGCLAGPVVCAAVAWRDGTLPTFSRRLRDSKKIATAPRTQLARELVGHPDVIWHLAWADRATIDRLNILRASLETLADAVHGLHPCPAGVYVDGNQPIPLALPQQQIVGGDDLVPQIAAASIIAKVFRDRWMACLDQQHPGYDFARNKGYGTKEHIAAIHATGPCPEHRRSFAPVKQLALFA